MRRTKYFAAAPCSNVRVWFEDLPAPVRDTCDVSSDVGCIARATARPVWPGGLIGARATELWDAAGWEDSETMLIEHAGKRPTIDPTAWVAPDATLCGNVRIGPGVRILHGARLVGEAGGVIRIARDGIIMENAVIRPSATGLCSQR